MKQIKQALAQLELITNQQISRTRIPVVDTKQVRIGHMLIRKTRHSEYVVVDITKNVTVEKTFSKNAAVAVASSYLQNKDYSEVMVHDRTIEKHQNDCVFYKHIMQMTQCESKKKTIMTRMDIAEDEIHHARQKINKFVIEAVSHF
jgi:hypothetical protein